MMRTGSARAGSARTVVLTAVGFFAALGVLGYLWALLFVITKGDASLGESLNTDLAHTLRTSLTGWFDKIFS